MSAPDAAPLSESFGSVNVPLWGKNRYKNVRGGQGPKKDGFQGYTPRKRPGSFTKVCATAHEAAVSGQSK